MSRHKKTEVAAINIRIPVGHQRDYRALLSALFALRKGVRVFGDTFVAVSYFNPDSGYGAFTKYTEIDVGGEWFDLDAFAVAKPEKIEEIFIPQNLRPNHASFYFTLDSSLHIIAFEKYSDSKSLSPRAVEIFFKEVFTIESIVQEFGRVEVDIVKSYSEVDRILNLPMLRLIRLTIRKPNPDDISGGLAKIIEDRLREQNADELEEVLRSSDDGLKPNKRTRELAHVAAENGHIHAKNLENGILKDHDSSETPLVETEKYSANDATAQSVFIRLSQKLFGVIREKRAKVDE